MTDDEIRQSARGMVLSWIAELALMLRTDQPPDTAGLDAHSRIVDRHIDQLLTIRAGLAERWGWPAPPDPFPFERPGPQRPTRCSDCGRGARELQPWYGDVGNGVEVVAWLGPTCHRRRLAEAERAVAMPLGGER